MSIEDVGELDTKLYEHIQERQRLEAQVMSLVNRQASTRENVVKLKERVRALRLERAELQAKVDKGVAELELTKQLHDARIDGFLKATQFFVDRLEKRGTTVAEVASALERAGTADGITLAGPFTADEAAEFVKQIEQANVEA